MKLNALFLLAVVFAFSTRPLQALTDRDKKGMGAVAVVATLSGLALYQKHIAALEGEDKQEKTKELGRFLGKSVLTLASTMHTINSFFTSAYGLKGSWEVLSTKDGSVSGLNLDGSRTEIKTIDLANWLKTVGNPACAVFATKYLYDSAKKSYKAFTGQE